MRPIHPIQPTIHPIDIIILMVHAINPIHTTPINPTILIPLPIRQHVPNLRRVRQAIHILKVLPGELKRPRRDVRDVLAHQLARVDRRLIDLLQQEGAEGFDARPQEGRVEGHVDALERDGSEAALEIEGLRLGCRLRRALADDLHEVILDVVQGQGLHQLLDVDFLCLQVVEDAGQGVQGAEVAGAHILHVGDVVIDDLQQPGRLLGDVADDVLERFFVKRLGDAAWVDGAHGVVGAACLVTLDGNLHGETSVEDDGDQTFDGHDIGQGSKSRVLSKRVTGETAVSLDESLRPHILKAGLLHEGQGRLGELRCGE